MGIVIGWCWAMVVAGGVYALLSKEAQRRRESGDEWAAIGAPDPGSAAMLTFFFAIAAPFVLGKHRGARGVVEGLALLAVAIGGTTVTAILLAALRLAANGR